MSAHLEQVRQGFETLDFEPEVKQAALDALAPWLSDERFADSRPQLERLVEKQAWEALFDAFWQVIPFGTGGRRGPVGLGTNRINHHTLLTSVQGHAEILKETYPGEQLTVVVAFDVRVFQDRRGIYDPDLPNPLMDVRSADFAARAAAVYAANGLNVLMLDPNGDTFMSTPELSLAIRRHGAHGGLNVSASHNHPDDNGGKFYNRHGGQDVPPDDETLADRVVGIERATEMPFEEAVSSGRVRFFDGAENEAYLALNAALSLTPQRRGGKIVFTPLHGTGKVTVGRLLRNAGFEVHAVPEQEDFDGGFPAVKFLAPNPEVPSCYELARKVGDAVGADMLMSTDPDADRIGIEVRDPDGGWRFVTGNEIILLVTRFVLEERRKAGTLPDDAFVLTTLVTTNRATTIAASYGCHVVPDLMVGFKYMAEVMASLEDTGSWRDLTARPESFVLGMEESHGLLLSHEVRDKDAAGAALALAELNATLVARGSSMFEELDAIYKRFGYMSNKLFTTVMTGATGLDRIRAIQKSLRANPPKEVAGRKVVGFDDCASPEFWMGDIKSRTDAASRNVLVLTLEGDARLVIRPSGTEPKNKIYVEVPGVTPTDDLTDAELAAEKRRCEAAAEELGRDFERLMLSRVGIELTPSAARVSNLLGLDEKVHFGTVFLPGLLRRARDGAADLESWVQSSLATYGKDPQELVAPGVAHFLGDADLDGAARERVGALFGL